MSVQDERQGGELLLPPGTAIVRVENELGRLIDTAMRSNPHVRAKLLGAAAMVAEASALLYDQKAAEEPQAVGDGAQILPLDPTHQRRALSPETQQMRTVFEAVVGSPGHRKVVNGIGTEEVRPSETETTLGDKWSEAREKLDAGRSEATSDEPAAKQDGQTDDLPLVQESSETEPLAVSPEPQQPAAVDSEATQHSIEKTHEINWDDVDVEATVNLIVEEIAINTRSDVKLDEFGKILHRLIEAKGEFISNPTILQDFEPSDKKQQRALYSRFLRMREFIQRTKYAGCIDDNGLNNNARKYRFVPLPGVVIYKASQLSASQEEQVKSNPEPEFEIHQMTANELAGEIIKTLPSAGKVYAQERHDVISKLIAQKGSRLSVDELSSELSNSLEKNAVIVGVCIRELQSSVFARWLKSIVSEDTASTYYWLEIPEDIQIVVDTNEHTEEQDQKEALSNDPELDRGKLAEYLKSAIQSAGHNVTKSKEQIIEELVTCYGIPKPDSEILKAVQGTLTIKRRAFRALLNEISESECRDWVKTSLDEDGIRELYYLEIPNGEAPADETSAEESSVDETLTSEIHEPEDADSHQDPSHTNEEAEPASESIIPDDEPTQDSTTSETLSLPPAADKLKYLARHNNSWGLEIIPEIGDDDEPVINIYGTEVEGLKPLAAFVFFDLAQRAPARKIKLDDYSTEFRKSMIGTEYESVSDISIKAALQQIKGRLRHQGLPHEHLELDLDNNQFRFLDTLPTNRRSVTN